MGKMFVLDKTGHTTHVWDPDNSTETEIARDIFDKFRAKGYRAFRSDDGEQRGRMDTFDPRAGEVMFVPQLQGG